MDRIQSFARVLVGAIALYVGINILVMMVAPIGMMIYYPDIESLGLMALSLLISAACLVALLYFGVYRPQRVIRLITSDVGLREPLAQGHWLPAAYRLACMFAGLYCVYRFVYGMTRVLALCEYYRSTGTWATSPIRPEEILTTLVLLGLGIYLLVGAPHFVRWHLKRTARFCAENTID
jgi:hypothetical protein